MERTTHHITEYRDNQDIDFENITSFKILNHGESTVDINTIPVYPGQMLKIVEEDSTFCSFNLKAVFTESGKLPKFKAIYKQLDGDDSSAIDNLHPNLVYAATLYNYEQGDIVDFSQNIAGHTILTLSFDGGVTFLPENDIDLGFVDANVITTYNLGGSLDTNAIQFRNDDLQVNSEIFVVGVVVEPFNVQVFSGVNPYMAIAAPTTYSSNIAGHIILKYQHEILNPDFTYSYPWDEINLGVVLANDNNNIVFPNIDGYIVNFQFYISETEESSQVFAMPPGK